ncbi:hypothetical protein EB061_06125 [bacterium]|nr:hypothetical protein [bacterium]
MGIGILALLTGKTAEIITIACFGAITLYILSLLSFFQLRRTEPELPRPFRAPFFPHAQRLALAIAIVSLASMLVLNPALGAIFVLLGGIPFSIKVLLKPSTPEVHP